LSSLKYRAIMNEIKDQKHYSTEELQSIEKQLAEFEKRAIISFLQDLPLYDLKKLVKTSYDYHDGNYTLVMELKK